MQWGRSNRKQYWLLLAMLLAVSLTLSYFKIRTANAAIGVAWILIWVQRLHDCGRPAWFVAFPIAMEVAILVSAFLVAGSELSDAMQFIARGGAGIVTNFGAGTYLIAILAILIVHFGFTIFWGVIRGDADENRYGGAPSASDTI